MDSILCCHLHRNEMVMLSRRSRITPSATWAKKSTPSSKHYGDFYPPQHPRRSLRSKPHGLPQQPQPPLQQLKAAETEPNDLLRRERGKGPRAQSGSSSTQNSTVTYRRISSCLMSRSSKSDAASALMKGTAERHRLLIGTVTCMRTTSISWFEWSMVFRPGPRRRFVG